MRVTIVPDDGAVLVDGRCMFLDPVALAALLPAEYGPEIHAVQWYGDHGEIEFKHLSDDRRPLAVVIDNIDAFEPVLDAWEKLRSIEDAPSVPPPVVAQDIKNEARRRILARFADWKQANMTARGVELQDIWRRVGAWTQAEIGEAAALQAAWDWIKAVRLASDGLEKTLPDDYRDDRHWPGID